MYGLSYQNQMSQIRHTVAFDYWILGAHFSVWRAKLQKKREENKSKKRAIVIAARQPDSHAHCGSWNEFDGEKNSPKAN